MLTCLVNSILILLFIIEDSDKPCHRGEGGQVSVQKEKETVKKQELCAPLSLPADRPFPAVVKTAGVTLKSHPSGSVDRGSSLTLAFRSRENPGDLGTMPWRRCSMTSLHVLLLETPALSLTSIQMGVDPTGESVALFP